MKNKDNPMNQSKLQCMEYSKCKVRKNISEPLPIGVILLFICTSHLDEKAVQDFWANTYNVVCQLRLLILIYYNWMANYNGKY